MPYTGNLVRLNQKPDALKLPPPSPRLAVNDGAPELQRKMQSVRAATGAEFQGTDFERVVEAGHGMLLDTPATSAGTPPAGGDSESPWHIDYTRGNPHTSAAILSARGAAAMAGGAGRPDGAGAPAHTSLRHSAHDGRKDRGWIRSLFWPDPMFQGSQPRSEINPDGPSASVDQAEGPGGQKYVRGINSLGVNNPNGWRNGRYRYSSWPNEVFAQIRRTIGTQMLQPRDIYTPGPQQRMVSTMVTAPALPKDPPNPDDPITAQSVYSSAASSVIGGF